MDKHAPCHPQRSEAAPFLNGILAKRRHQVREITTLNRLPNQTVLAGPFSLWAVVSPKQKIQQRQRYGEVPVDTIFVAGVMPVVVVRCRENFIQPTKFKLQVAVNEYRLQGQNGQVEVDCLVGESQNHHRHQADRAGQQHVDDV